MKRAVVSNMAVKQEIAKGWCKGWYHTWSGDSIDYPSRQRERDPPRIRLWDKSQQPLLKASCVRAGFADRTTPQRDTSQSRCGAAVAVTVDLVATEKQTNVSSDNLVRAPKVGGLDNAVMSRRD